MKVVTVELGQRRYSIHIGAGLLANHDLLASAACGRQVLVVTDSHVAPHYLPKVLTALADKHVTVVELPPGEQEKNLANFERLMHTLANASASRDCTVLALGGGVVGDLAGFAAACWMRGVRFVQVPTTLLAMVDSSVGGKTAIDLASGKNLVGAFHQPAIVIADTDVLASLPDRELRAGLAEVVKYGAIADRDFFAWLENNADALLARDSAVIAQAIAVSCQHKAAIVARDETEQGDRMWLNFGHTFGHAIETEQGYGGLCHGEAVAIGMLLAARLSQTRGTSAPDDSARLHTLLTRLELPTALPTGLSAHALIERMKLDKKAVSGRLRLILWRGIGQATVVDDVSEAQILSVLTAQ